MDYTTLSLVDVKAQLEDVARAAQETFGGLDARQVNWRPTATTWSVAQCFEHLVTANGLMIRAADEALNPARPRTVWQRLPILPGILGSMLIRSQAPGATRKFTASPRAQPAASDIAPDIVQRFSQQHYQAAASVQALDERHAARAIMTSPFMRAITYSVLDGWRLIVAHDWRHFEQARRVAGSPGFP
jgi:DinB superfamily